MLECFQKSSFTGEKLWIEFTSTFRPHSIRALSSSSMISWIDFLIKRGVYVKRGRNVRQVKALCDLLTAESFEPFSVAQSETSIDSSKKNPDKDNNDENSQDQNQESTQTHNNNNHGGNMSGLGGLSKVYTGFEKFSGRWEENLE